MWSSGEAKMDKIIALVLFVQIIVGFTWVISFNFRVFGVFGIQFEEITYWDILFSIVFFEYTILIILIHLITEFVHFAFNDFDFMNKRPFDKN